MENSVIAWWIDRVSLKRKESVKTEMKSLTDEEIAEVLKSILLYEDMSDSFWYVKASIALDKKLKEKNQA